MGDTENIDELKSESGAEPNPSSQQKASTPSSSRFAATEAPSGSVPLSDRLQDANGDDRAQVRRSSLRPAPPSFRPNARDASQLRPAMVIHAGDAIPSAPKWDIPEPPASQASQAPLDSAARHEPFALAEDLSSKPTHEPTLPLELEVAGVPVGSREQPHLAAAPRIPLELASITTTGSAPLAPPPASVAQAENSAGPSSSKGSKQHRAIAAGATAALLVGVIAATILGRRSDPASSDVAAPPRPSVAADVAGPISPALDAPELADPEHARPTPKEPEPARAEANASAPNSGAAAGAAPAKLNQKPGATAAAAAVVGAAAAGAAAGGVAPASANVSHVTLEVKPTDAKVIYRGMAHPGPPYQFDVPKGKRIAVEVARFGFVTRKVVIDDKKPVISIGLLKTGGQKYAR